MSQKAATGGASVKKKANREKGEEYTCKWANCTAGCFPVLTSLVDHVTNNHLQNFVFVGSLAPPRYVCLWEGCSRYEVEQPSKFALISHCRTHTGEKPYFCPLPECEKHFTRSDALAKHVKGVHDLHPIRDAIGLMRTRSDKRDLDLGPRVDLNRLTDDQYRELLARDYELRVPWWYSQRFTDGLQEQSSTLQTIYDQEIETRQNDLANLRYKKFLTYPDEELITARDTEQNPVLKNLADDIKSVTTSYIKPIDYTLRHEFDETAEDCERLRSVLATATKVNKIVRAQLNSAVKERRRLWVLNRILLEANVQKTLPKNDDAPKTDEIDEFVMREGIAKE